jgi:hypothetical protein
MGLENADTAVRCRLIEEIRSKPSSEVVHLPVKDGFGVEAV